MNRWLPTALVLIQALPGAAEPARLTDTQVEDLARQALVSNNPDLQASTLHQLQVHHFKSSKAKEREICLFAQGTLEDRLGQPARAAITFHRLEADWPASKFLPEAQVVMALAAIEHSRPKEAEIRLHKAMGAELPVESLRRAQELYLWVLADQGRSAEGVEIFRALKPLGTAKPTERGLVGIIEAACIAKQLAEAQSALVNYHSLYPSGPRLHRVDLDLAKLLGTLGEAGAAAKAFQKLIVTAPNSPEADEARLALATLLTDGKLTAKESQALPSPKTLLAQLDKSTLKDAPTRQATVLKLRVAVKDRQWETALAIAGQVRALHPTEPEALEVGGLRQEAMRSWTQEQLDKHQVAVLLPFLNGEGITCLTPAQRTGLATTLARTGLPEAATQLMNASPAGERPALRKQILAVLGSGNPSDAAALLPAKGGTPAEDLTRAQAHLVQAAWAEARTDLAKAKPGPERIQAILALLHRPAEPKQAATARLKEAEGWLAHAPEKGAEREPLVLLVADLKAREGDWKGALATYPAAPQPGNRGWVALMRATCMARLGRVAEAKEALQAAGAEPAFKAEREALASRLGR